MAVNSIEDPGKFGRMSWLRLSLLYDHFRVCRHSTEFQESTECINETDFEPSTKRRYQCVREPFDVRYVETI